MNKNQPQNQQPADLPQADASRRHYTTPEGYFEGLADKIMSRLPDDVEQPEPPVSWWVKIQPSLYLAACFVGLYLSFKAFDIFRDRQMDRSVASASAEIARVDNAVSDDEYLQFYCDYTEGLMARQTEWQLALDEEEEL